MWYNIRRLCCGVEQLVAHAVHIREAAGSSPAPAYPGTVHSTKRGFMPYQYKALKVHGHHIDQHRKVIDDSSGAQIPDGCVVHRKDGDKRNNSLTNLTVMTRAEHSRLHHPVGTWLSSEVKTKLLEAQLAYWKNRPSPVDRPVVQLSLSGEVVARFRSARDAQRKTGHFNSHIILCCKGKRRTHHGFMWRYDEV